MTAPQFLWHGRPRPWTVGITGRIVRYWEKQVAIPGFPHSSGNCWLNSKPITGNAPVPQNVQPHLPPENPMSPTDVRPPFTRETALMKVKMAETAWNTRDPERVALAYSPDSAWRNRDEFFHGREAIVAFLKRKWAKELDYRLMKELWCFTGNRISVCFEYEWHDAAGQWYRSHGNEHWEFDDSGLMCRRDASINDVKIAEIDRRYRM